MLTLDTNILIYYADGDERVTHFLISKLEKDIAIFLPTIVVIEFLAFPALTSKERTFFTSLLLNLPLFLWI